MENKTTDVVKEIERVDQELHRAIGEFVGPRSDGAGEVVRLRHALRDIALRLAAENETVLKQYTDCHNDLTNEVQENARLKERAMDAWANYEERSQEADRLKAEASKLQERIDEHS